MATRFELVVDADGYFMDFFDKPVYAYTYQESEEQFGWMAVIAFYGRRYFLTQVNWLEQFPDATNGTAAQIYVDQIRYNREQGWALGFEENATLPVFISDPLDLGSGGDKLTPTSLSWYYATTDIYGLPLAVGPAVSTSTRLVCEQCNDFTESCEYGMCIRDDSSDYFGTCDCFDGFTGSLCEHYDPTAANATKIRV